MAAGREGAGGSGGGRAVLGCVAGAPAVLGEQSGGAEEDLAWWRMAELLCCH